jgi:hypothetical protein
MQEMPRDRRTVARDFQRGGAAHLLVKQSKGRCSPMQWAGFKKQKQLLQKA